MKLSGRRIDDFVRAPDDESRAALVYGPDEGLVRERALGLVKVIAEDANDPFRVVEMTSAKVEQDGAALADEAAAISMLGGRRVIRIRDATDRLSSLMGSFLEDPPGDAFIVLEAAELSARSSLRRLFETAANAAALACYADEGAVLGEFIRETLIGLGVEADHDAINFLESVCGSDRQLTRRELEKVALYVGRDGGQLTVEMARNCVGDSSVLVQEDIAFAAGMGDQARLDRALRRYFSEGGSAVGVLRVVASHINRLQRVVGTVDQGQSIAHAISGLRPPVFFKRQDEFRRQAGVWTQERLTTAQKIVLDTELKCKTTGIPDRTVCARALMQVAAAAGRSR
ncbi:MAG: DNA polymerase III subunit delta [Proteobacteria bacterium]|nr:DNA polymerase III subunit delta [Pseudomonadota bacterium]